MQKNAIPLTQLNKEQLRVIDSCNDLWASINNAAPAQVPMSPFKAKR